MNFLRVRRGGFTLVELLIVIAIITVLIAIGLPVMQRVREKAKQTACIANLHQIQMALRLYRLDEGGYPGPYDPVGGQGGINALYPTYVTSRKLLICPDDPIESPEAYRTQLPFQIRGVYDPQKNPQATLLDRVDAFYDSRPMSPDPISGKAGGTYISWRNLNFFTESYSSYNLLYNWMGYIWWDANPKLPIRAAKAGDETRYEDFIPVLPGALSTGTDARHWVGWADNIAFWYKWFVYDPESQFGPQSGDKVRDFVENRLPYYLAQNVYWQYYPQEDKRIYRNPSNGALYPLQDSLKRDLWSVASPDETAPADFGVPSGVFPGLINHNAPENTIVTRCPYHRPFTKNADIALRLDGTVDTIPGPPYREYNWAVQPKAGP